MDEIRILMVDDHSLFRESLSRFLETDPTFRVVGQCRTITEAIAAYSQTPTDVVLLDYDLGEEQGSRLLSELKSQLREPRVLMVTAGMSDASTLEAMEAGASGVFLKHSSLDQLISAIHQVVKGEIWLDKGAAHSLFGRGSTQKVRFERVRPLTIRQGEVLRGILDGLTNKEIAWNLKVSESSVKAVIQELFHKAGVRTRSQLVRIVIERHPSDWLRPDSAE
ncbi:response regulator transcription factor [Alloacidobacterium dinghuense]|uniref:Response regulator transcription factor n=1 Tax=Alloacidobacterium dinghuense TaxID=2763107 RepID=A0A7G8BCD4_9BACT|nr:response regulator transcription factor [Alloacidobacterium dinghuense]QNI30204.1 response regulator transcription factor [Alloacidobacterium dinghuense]